MPNSAAKFYAWKMKFIFNIRGPKEEQSIVDARSSQAKSVPRWIPDYDAVWHVQRRCRYVQQQWLWHREIEPWVAEAKRLICLCGGITKDPSRHHLSRFRWTWLKPAHAFPHQSRVSNEWRSYCRSLSLLDSGLAPRIDCSSFGPRMLTLNFIHWILQLNLACWNLGTFEILSWILHLNIVYLIF